MIKASARPKYDTAILGAEYDSDTARFLADRLRARLNESRCVWMREPLMADAEGTTTSDVCGNARTVIVLHDRLWGRTPPTNEDAPLSNAHRPGSGIDGLLRPTRRGPAALLGAQGEGHRSQQEGARRKHRDPAGVDQHAGRSASRQGPRRRDCSYRELRATRSRSGHVPRLAPLRTGVRARARASC